jgi:hypothetical protein
MFPSTRAIIMTGARTLIKPFPAGAGRYTVMLHGSRYLLGNLLRLQGICGFLNSFLHLGLICMAVFIILCHIFLARFGSSIA